MGKRCYAAPSARLTVFSLTLRCRASDRLERNVAEDQSDRMRSALAAARLSVAPFVLPGRGVSTSRSRRLSLERSLLQVWQVGVMPSIMADWDG